jgi:serine/threonine protein kinase
MPPSSQAVMVAPMNITLTVQAGPQVGHSFVFDSHDTFLVGRGEDVHFRLADDPSMSRKHFLLEVNPPLCRLQDLRSRTGTSVNGRRIESVELSHGDQIHAGQTVFLVSIDKTGVDDPDVTILPPSPNTVPPNYPMQTLPWREHPDLPGIPGYAVVREIARGGMGVVYEATRRLDGSLVAIKTLLPAAVSSRIGIERFLREARILQDLTHPNIVAFTDMGEVSGLLWFAMEYVPGPDICRHIRAHGPFEIGEGVRLGLQLLDALTYAHAKRFVHRDVKPSNVMLMPTHDGRVTLKLSDFGLARTYQASQISGLTMTGTSGGTPIYMAPEQVRHFRDVKPAADQYSAAATIYYVLTGQTVFDPVGEYLNVMLQVLEGNLVPIEERRPGIPAALTRVIHRALRHLPEERFADVHEFAKALKPFASA